MPAYVWPIITPQAPVFPSAGTLAGPMTIGDLLEVWKSATDPNYHLPILAQGEGRGLEVITQGLAQLERVSQAIDRTTQSMYILPWSGQTDEPASGARFARVTLTVERAIGVFSTKELTFTAGQVLFEQETTDQSLDGPEVVRPGRIYSVEETRTLGPGESGPLEIPVVAIRPGRAYNNVPPGGIRRFKQAGAGLSNTGATVTPGVTQHRLVVRNAADVVVPENVGQYVHFDSGQNVGQLRRIIGYEPPQPPTHGGVALLAPTIVMRMSLLGIGFLYGEEVTGVTSGARALFIHDTAVRLVVDRISGTFVGGEMVVGAQSGAVGVIDVVEQNGDLFSEIGTAAWTIARWEEDLKLTVTHTLSPEGGRAPMLDELGHERKIPRSPGEDDDHYRKRVAKLADTVAPNAIERAANRVLATYGGHGCLREVGSAKFRGLFYDGDASSTDPNLAFATDLDFVAVSGAAVGTILPGEAVTQTVSGVVASGRAVGRWTGSPAVFAFEGIAGVTGTFVSGTPMLFERSGASIATPVVSGGLQERDRWKVWLDYIEFRAFLIVGVPDSSSGDFGVFYDAGSYGAYDAAPFYVFTDALPATAALLNRSVWQSVDKARAGGVGHDLYVERGDCT